jgi:membrane associated rhomboid family serine protease
MFGRILENVWHAKRFLFFYLACGIGAAIAHMIIEYFQYKDVIAFADMLKMQGNYNEAKRILDLPAYAVGASGAVMGIFAAFAYLFPNTELFIMFIPVPIKAKWAVLGLVAIDLFSGVSRFSGDNVAHFAHLGGAVTGFIIVYIWNKSNKKTFY